MAMFLLLLLLALPASVHAQPAPIGTYRLAEECTIEIAPVAKDTVRMQMLCKRGPPGYHSGFVDARLPVHGKVIYNRREGDQHCRIAIRFEATRAIVTQQGTDIACGFGAGVSADGTYRRTSRRRPPFDLDPVGG